MQKERIENMIGKIYCEDCLETMKRMADKSIDLVLTDPPYGIGNKFKGGKNSKLNKFNSIVEKGWDVIPSDEIFNEIFRISKYQIIWGGNYFKLPPTRGFLIWDKKISQDFSMSMAEYGWTSFDKLSRIHRESSDKIERLHPTQKNESIIEFSLNYALEYDKNIKTIYDPFAGSGTTLVVAKSRKFDYIGSELDKDYYEIIQKRLQTVQGSLF